MQHLALPSHSVTPESAQQYAHQALQAVVAALPLQTPPQPLLLALSQHESWPRALLLPNCCVVPLLLQQTAILAASLALLCRCCCQAVLVVQKLAAYALNHH
jgi:hypothetical protein